LLTQAMQQETGLRQQASTQTLSLIDQEKTARVTAAQHQAGTDAERAANVKRIENEILTVKRQTLPEALADYRQHVDALNAEANRHLGEIKRIEEEKRQLSMSTAERIREIQRQGMTDFEATEDRKRQVVEWQQKAREALVQGEFDQAQQFAQKAMELAAQVASSKNSEAKRAADETLRIEKEVTQVLALEEQARQAHRAENYQKERELQEQAAALREQIANKAVESEKTVGKAKADVLDAIGQIRDSEEILNQTLDKEAAAHKSAAAAAITARDSILETIDQTQAKVDKLTAELKEGLKLTLEADTTRFDQALTDLDQALAEKERLVVIKADLEQAEKQLQQYEQLLKEGKTLPVDADVSKAKAALDQLATYARDQQELELKVSAEKATAAITNVDNQLRALDNIQTESQHQVSSNADAVRSEIQSLNGQNTSSTHTIYVTKVETNATGGLVGGVPGFASGGSVNSAPGAFPKMAGGTVPGSGHQDSVPRTLDAGSFVLRKAAVRKYGALLAQIPGLRHFATGGYVLTTEARQARNKDVAEALATVDLGLQSHFDYFNYLKNALPTGFAPQSAGSLANAAARQHESQLRDMLGKEQLDPNDQAELAHIKSYWETSMAQAKLWGEDRQAWIEAALAGWQEPSGQKGAAGMALFAAGGLAPSDTVPAMLTPGEVVIRKEAVSRFGVGFFTSLNNLQMPVQSLVQRVRGYAEGGVVGGLGERMFEATRRLRALPGADLGSALAEQLSRDLRRPEPTFATEAAAPSRTVRVELASGERQVAATVDARDESRLLDLLKEARARSY
jgi:hypothetical protein